MRLQILLKLSSWPLRQDREGSDKIWGHKGGQGSAWVQQGLISWLSNSNKGQLGDVHSLLSLIMLWRACLKEHVSETIVWQDLTWLGLSKSSVMIRDSTIWLNIHLIYHFYSEFFSENEMIENVNYEAYYYHIEQQWYLNFLFGIFLFGQSMVEYLVAGRLGRYGPAIESSDRLPLHPRRSMTELCSANKLK